MREIISFWIKEISVWTKESEKGREIMEKNGKSENPRENNDRARKYFKIDFIRNKIENENEFLAASRIFSLLSDASRLKIFWILCHSKESVQDVANIMKMTGPAVSHHLKLLKEFALVESYRDGKEVFYSASKTEKCKELHKIIEKLMAVTCPDFDSSYESLEKEEFEKIERNFAGDFSEDSEYSRNQILKIRKVHDYLMENLSKRITIEELAKEFAMNATTLKTVFKDVYGSSVASHIKTHRMEKAAEILVKTDKNICEVAFEVGYESQSKFGAAFKEAFNVSPMEYRKMKR